MAVRGDGGYCGYVSGGCTEAAVFRYYPPMRWRHHTGNPCRQGVAPLRQI
ncbi:XdhC family protein [Agrobacterium sp. CG674]